MKSIAPGLDNIQLILLLDKDLPAAPVLDDMEPVGIGPIFIFASNVTSQLVDQVHERGFRAIVWGLGEKGLQADKIITRYKLMISKDVDGFACAHPDKLQQLIRGASR